MTVLPYQSADLTDADADAPQGHWFLWAIFLAMSWTWCIGMILPVLLVRDYGFWGWVTFAVPNVLGAAAMGWVIRTRNASVQLVRAHRRAIVSFSLATASFQVFAAGWVMNMFWMAVAVLLVALVVHVATSVSAHGGRIAGVVTLTISSVCLGLFLGNTDFRNAVRSSAPPRIADWPNELLALAPVSAFGFLLCPYMDATFHVARQHTSARSARLAFGVGFGAVFFVMILFSLFYANQSVNSSVVVWALVAHFTVQLGFTTGVHWWASAQLFNARFRPLFLIIVGTAAIGLLSLWFARRVPLPNPMRVREGGELVYRVYMAFYALVFPTYVWLCMLGSATRHPTKRACVALAVTVLLAAPMFWLGFIEGRMVWLLPGLGVVLLARLFVPRPFKFTG